MAFLVSAAQQQPQLAASAGRALLLASWSSLTPSPAPPPPSSPALLLADERGLARQAARQQPLGLSRTRAGRPVGLPSLLLLARGFASSGLVPDAPVGAPPGAADKVSRAQAVLSQLPVVKLRQELEIEADHSLHVPFPRFVDMARECGAATDTATAEQVLNTLQQAGIVLRQGGIVYLRAEEVAEMVMLTLPGGKEDAQAKLARVERELTELDKVHDQLERRAHRRANALLTAGLAVLVFQFVAFVYLTWWELSWDVMEPIAYIIGLFYSIVGYAYFLSTRHAFDLQPMQEFWAKRFKDRTAVKVQFDESRYQYLRKLADRYKRHLAHVRV